MAHPSSPRLGVFHCTFAGAVVLGLLFLLCWFGVAVANIPASRRMLAFLTSRSLDSPGAMVEGLGFAILFGALIGALIAIGLNALGMMLKPPRGGSPPP